MSVARLALGLVLVGGGRGSAQDAAPPTFATDVAPLVHARCYPCHRPGQTTPFTLASYEDVASRRRQIALVVERRLMPPWLPTEGDFLDDRRLEDEELATLLAWVEAGAPRGDAAREPEPPELAPGWQIGEPDLVVTAPVAVEVPADGPDLFRNLVLPVELEAERFVEVVEIRPGSPAVHHAILNVDRTRDSRRRDALDELPGFPGMTLGLSEPPDGHFVGWTPGKLPRVNPPGMAWRLAPGDDLVLQVHLTPTGKPERVAPRIGFRFTDTPTAIRPEPLVLHSEQIDIPAGEADWVLRDHLVLPVGVTVHALYPHAHFLCRTMRARATLPDGSERTLFAIADWDFDWQDDYRLRTPLALPAGTRLSIEYRYDNSDANPSNPSSPPRRVTFGQESTDEMGSLTLTTVVEDELARQALRAASASRNVEKRPWDWGTWLELGVARRELGELQAALEAFGQALELRPEYPEALVELGITFQGAGDLDTAVGAYREALRIDPEQSVAHLWLGDLLARAGETGEAIEHFERALEVHSRSVALRNNLATALFVEGRLEEAEGHYRRALELEPEHFNARFNLGRVLAALGREAEARQELERADGLRPGHPAVAEALRALAR